TPPAATSAPTVRPGEPITLNFVNAEIEAVAQTLGQLVGRQVVVDPRVKGTISLSTDKPLPPHAALNQFMAALRLRGFALVEAEGLYKVVPEAEAKLQSPTVLNDKASASGGQIVTQIFRLNHENANNLVQVLRPLISPNNTINVNPGTNALVITDYADNLRRLGRIVAAMDVSNASDVEVIPLQHALANDLAPLVQRLIDGSGAVTGVATGGADTSFKTVLLPEPRSNALILRAANPARVALVRSLVSKLDRPNSTGANGNIHVVYLKNADAVQLATTLRAALAADNASASTGGNTTTGGTGGATSPATAAPARSGNAAGSAVASSAAPSVGGQIQADPATNALIISAPEPQYRQLRAVIDRLDMRRAQVYVESLIAEVNADKAAEFGVQWQGALGRAGDGVVGLLGTNFSTSAAANILNVATGAALPSAGLNIGAAQRTNGTYVLSFLARFIEQNGEGNILSTPNLLTLDNEEAKIVIGQNVPFVTGQYTNNNSANGAVNPFQTVERKDVGLTLRVKPQISENGTVKMNIFQEVSSVLSSTLKDPNGPTTNKRSIESSVLVDDGNIVVLGGLLSDEYGGNEDKVPLLGDLPVLGNLFKSERRNRKKTNLMVFLRPVVIRDTRQSDSLAQDRYELMRAAQIQQQPKPSSVLGINEAPALPELDLSGRRTPLSGLVQQAAPADATPASAAPQPVLTTPASTQAPASPSAL
ncbi:MAG: type II secretion system secretin GspD, partial [Macromonas bipunctata]|nr:type II secretion system secretin GspD [Macromonas bipunctata]